MPPTVDEHGFEGRTERQSGPRTGLVLGLTALIVGVLGGGAFAASRFVGGDDDGPAGPATTAAEPELAAADEIDSPTKLFQRTTEGGVDLRVFRSDQAPMWGMPGENFDDERPAFCRPSGTVQATAIGAAAVVSSQATITEDPGEQGNVGFSVGGVIEDEPLLVFVIQVPAGTAAVGASSAGGGRDSMTPVDGIAALVVPAPEALAAMWSGIGGVAFNGDPWQGILVEFQHDDGSTTRLSGDDLNSGLSMSFNDPICWEQPPLDPDAPVVTIPPPTLPPGNGELPPDPAAARTEIRAAMDAVYRPGPANDERRVQLIDDPSGVQFMLDRLRDDPNGREIDADHFEVLEIGFLTAVEASFFYELRMDDYMDWGLQYGRARFIDGAWKITRATLCNDYSKTNNSCGP